MRIHSSLIAFFFDASHSEMMVCNFTSHMEVVSSLNLETLRLKLHNGQPTEDLNTSE